MQNEKHYLKQPGGKTIVTIWSFAKDNIRNDNDP